MMFHYNKVIESWRYNDVDNVSAEFLLEAPTVMLNIVADHQPVVIFTKENMDEDKPFPVINIPPVRFIGGSTRQVRTGSIQVSWVPEISVAVIITVGVSVE